MGLVQDHTVAARSLPSLMPLPLCETFVPLGTCCTEPLLGPSQKMRPSDPNPVSDTNRPDACMAQAQVSICTIRSSPHRRRQGPAPLSPTQAGPASGK